MQSDRLDGGGACLIPDGWQEDPSATATFEAVLRRRAQRPEQRIMLAMIEQALADMKYATWEDENARDIAREARNWMLEPSIWLPANKPRVTFADACEAVKLDVDYLRRMVERTWKPIPARLEPPGCTGTVPVMSRVRQWIGQQQGRPFTAIEVAVALGANVKTIRYDIWSLVRQREVVQVRRGVFESARRGAVA